MPDQLGERPVVAFEVALGALAGGDVLGGPQGAEQPAAVPERLQLAADDPAVGERELGGTVHAPGRLDRAGRGGGLGGVGAGGRVRGGRRPRLWVRCRPRALVALAVGPGVQLGHGVDDRAERGAGGQVHPAGQAEQPREPFVGADHPVVDAHEDRRQRERVQQGLKAGPVVARGVLHPALTCPGPRPTLLALVPRRRHGPGAVARRGCTRTEPSKGMIRKLREQTVCGLGGCDVLGCPGTPPPGVASPGARPVPDPPRRLAP